MKTRIGDQLLGAREPPKSPTAAINAMATTMDTPGIVISLRAVASVSASAARACS